MVSHEVIVNLFAATTTRKGLKVRAELDSRPYPKGIKVTDEEFAAIRILRDEFHVEWNYTILPSNKQIESHAACGGDLSESNFVGAIYGLSGA